MAEEDYVTSQCVKQIKTIVESLLALSIAEGVHHPITVQLCRQFFHYLDVSLFNRIIAGDEQARSSAQALKIKYFLSQLADWCSNDETPRRGAVLILQRRRILPDPLPLNSY